MNASVAELQNPEATVREWGFKHVFTWTDGPYVLNHDFWIVTRKLTSSAMPTIRHIPMEA